MHEQLHIFDDTIVRLIQSLPRNLDGFMQVVTFIGQPAITISIIVIVISYGLLRERRIAIAGGIAGFTFVVNGLLKLIIHRHRPLTANLLHLDTYSFPSGHTAGSTLAFGLIAILLYRIVPRPWRMVVVIVAAILIFLVGISRIYLGAHYPSDVIGGWIVGGIGIMIISLVFRRLRKVKPN